MVAPALAQLTEKYPQLGVRFDLFDRLVDVGDEGFDRDIRIDDDIAPHLIARRLASNHRVLCALPTYLEQNGTPRQIADLSMHRCLVIKERDHPFGVWRLAKRGEMHSVKVTGPLSTNHGEVTVQWTLAGRGIMLRLLWDIRPYLERGELRQVLPTVTQPANGVPGAAGDVSKSTGVRGFSDGGVCATALRVTAYASRGVCVVSCVVS